MDTAKTVESPPRCPACQSANVVTTSKKVDADTYWRCDRCGEVWNIARRESGSRGYRRSR